MDNFVTLASFTYPSEMVVVRSKLESEGIACYVKDELTVQVYNFYSNAIGGIRLEVRQSDYEEARRILIEIGFLEEEEVPEISKFWVFVEEHTKNIPLLKKLRLELRLIVASGLIAAVILFGILAIASIDNETPEQSNYEFLTNASWCLGHINYIDKDYAPKTIDTSRIKFTYGCEERIRFREDNTISIPGFNTFRIYGKWMLNNNKLIIYEMDTLQHTFEGTYSIETGNFELNLLSENTKIYCYGDY